MATFNTYASKAEPVNNDTMLLYDSENRNNKQVTMKNLSKALEGMQGTTIPSNTDLNDLTVPGAYFCATSAIASTLTNCPVGTNFTMLVMKKHTNLQTQVLFASTRILFRTRTSSSWQTWYTMANMENDVEPLQEQVGALRYLDFSIAKSSTATFTIPSGTQVKMIATGVANSLFAEVNIACASSGNLFKKEIFVESDIAINYSTKNKITVTNNNSSTLVRVKFLVMTEGKTITLDEPEALTTTSATTAEEGGE